MLLTGPSPVAELQGNRDQAHAGVGGLPGAAVVAATKLPTVTDLPLHFRPTPRARTCRARLGDIAATAARCRDRQPGYGARRPDPVDAFLVFLHLLKTNPELFAKFGLRETDLDTPQTDAPPHLDVSVSSRLRIELCRLQCPRFGFLAHAGRPVIRRRLGGGKASLHLGKNEILDKKANCGEHAENYRDDNSAPEQGLVPAHRSSRPHDTGLRQPQHELPDCTGVALNEFVEVLGNGDAIDIAASLNF